ncbi:MAG: D-alanyl-D-alanine carboxypeptidase [Bacilli bacterium]|nr:D-alanyl-D-alanine carboxypeptidase [Bacilli bacterium]
MKKIILLLILLIPFNVNAFSTTAKGTILMDIDSGRVLYAKNPHYAQSVASISKIMTAIIALENADIKKKVTIGNEVLKSYGSGIYIRPKEKIKLEDLIYGLMLRSGNDAALAIAYSVSKNQEEFVKLMNEKAKKLKMTDTTFNNPSGLDEKEEKGNYSSAYDMALLMSYAMKNKEFRKITGTQKHIVKTNKNTYVWHNKNKLLKTYEYTTGGKTGFTKKAKRTLVTSAKHNNLNLTIVTINDGNDWLDHKKLYIEAFKKYKSYTFLDKGIITVLGEDYYNNDTLFIKKDLKYPLLETEKESITLKYSLKKLRKYKNNDKVGNASLYIGEKEVNKVNIYIKKGKTHKINDK